QLFIEKANNKTEFSYNHRYFGNVKEEDWKKYWKINNNDDDKTELIHFIGKDNIVFHCITFPAILKATEQYILPDNVPANEFMNLEGDKISTSRNWAVWLHEYLQEFPGREDELRYTLIANMPENKDSEFTWQDFQNRVNSELGNNLGNFVKRVSDLLHKFYDGVVPEFDLEEVVKSAMPEIEDRSAIDEYTSMFEIDLDLFNQDVISFRFKDALRRVMALSSKGNAFLQRNEPWIKVKSDKKNVETVLAMSALIVSQIRCMCSPLLPNTADKIGRVFNLKPLSNNIFYGNYWGRFYENVEVFVAAGHKINPSEILFPKIEDEQVQAQIEKLNKSKAQQSVQTIPVAETTNALQPAKPEITYDDFSKLDIRTGKIIEAEKVPKADKLLKLLVDIGIEQRTIVSGIAEHFSPEEIVGKEVSVLINLAPRKLRGIESNGMILMAEDANGKLYFVNTDGVSAGNVIK
ncbi:MAG TPA: methionine--tRNA ligase subunit beta, partial [Chitinophagales bacterium]|nr:methionine--tRNA ligase subunit beta [Chitinophagales bacterium]